MNEVVLIGSEGSMGKRYQSILKALSIPFRKYDTSLKKYSKREITSFISDHGCKRVIIATPTDIHIDCLKQFRALNVNVLCEKPLVNKEEDLKEIKDIHLTVMNQYKYLIPENSEIHQKQPLLYCIYNMQEFHPPSFSYYNFFRSGNDGLLLDCYQIVNLSVPGTTVMLQNTSPIWQCYINGHTLNIADMDMAYVTAVKTWYENSYVYDPLKAFEYMIDPEPIEHAKKFFKFLKTVKRIPGGYIGQV